MLVVRVFSYIRGWLVLLVCNFYRNETTKFQVLIFPQSRAQIRSLFTRLLSLPTNLPRQQCPSDQIHRTAELRCGWGQRSLAWARETFLFNDTAPAEIYALSLADALPTPRAPVYRR